MNRASTSTGLAPPRRRRRSLCLAIEADFGRLEQRIAPAAFVVTTTADNGSDASPTPGSLREAIIGVNASGDATNAIAFNIPGAGVQTIAPPVDLPAIAKTVEIDGFSQPGATLGGPLVTLTGTGFGSHGLVLSNTSGGLVRGMVILNFGDGLTVTGGSNNRIQANFIGITADGASADGNGTGVLINGGATNVIVGTDGDGSNNAGERNVISGNSWGINISDFATATRVSGNYIGTDAAGDASVANSLGVRIDEGAAGTVLGTNGDGVGDESESNVISGNDTGVLVIDSSGNRIAGNSIGTNAAGDAAVRNVIGVHIGNGAIGNLVGTDGDGVSDDLERNVISGNRAYGIGIAGTGVAGNRIAGNYIGTNANGDGTIPNGIGGVTIQGGPSDNVIGTNGDGQGDAAEGNLISGNDGPGVYIAGIIVARNRVAGNVIGLNAAGNTALPNNGPGVLLEFGVAGNVIGTDGDGVSDTLERNVISGNREAGVRLGENVRLNRVAGNYIGVNAEGTIAIPNSSGVRIEAGASDNFIGTNGDGSGDEVEGNLISGNAYYGVQVVEAGTAGNRVAGNWIGLDGSGERPIPNSIGVGVGEGAAGNFVGTNGDGLSDALERNVISGNTQVGVDIAGPGTTGNRVAGNSIGPNVAGDAAIVNGTGVFIHDGAAGNFVGTNGDGRGDSAEGNLISGNGSYGVAVGGATPAGPGNKVAGNVIGLNAAGVGSMPNIVGVVITGGTSGTIIGTDGDGSGDALERNFISGNVSEGVVIGGAATTGNRIAGNFIGTDAFGAVAVGNRVGVLIEAGASGNVVGTDGDGQGDSAEANLISGNWSIGIRVTGVGTTGNRISGNRIGTDADGRRIVSNGTGVFIHGGAAANIIGTDGDGRGDLMERNLISGNLNYGVAVGGGADPAGVGNRVAGNVIGLRVVGDEPLPNNVGVIVTGSTRGTIVGMNGDGRGDDAERNVISGNTLQGVLISSAANGTKVAGNFIGTNAAGDVAIGNGVGVAIANAKSNFVGTDGDGLSDEFEGNFISGNAGAGVSIGGAGADDNRISGNRIGTNAVGTAALGNGGSGVTIASATAGNVVGTDGDGRSDEVEGNLISGNGGSGVAAGGRAERLRISGNLIGTNAAGDLAVPNGGAGVALANGVPSALVGGATDAERNVIAGNVGDGINLTDNFGASLLHNSIGVGADGSTPLGNGGHGVFIDGGSNNLVVSDPAAPGVIAYNGLAGVGIVGRTATGNQVFGYRIFANGGLGIDLNDDGVTPNHATSPTPGPNHYQNFPVLTAASADHVWGTLQSVPDRNFRIDVYANPTPDPSGHGQGKLYLGSIPATTDASGLVAFSGALSTASPLGWSVSATATDLATGDVSEFGADVIAAPTSHLVVTKAATPAEVAVGDALVFTVTVAASGPDAAANVVLTDTLPDGFTIVSATPNLGKVSIDGRAVSATLDSLPAGGFLTLTIVATADRAGGFVNTATVSADTADIDPSGHSASAAILVVQPPPPTPSADLQTTATADASTVAVGGRLTYTIVVSNAGPDAATRVQLAAALPAGVSVVSTSIPPSSASPSQLTFDLGAIAAGASATVVIVVTPTAVGPIVLEAVANAPESRGSASAPVAVQVVPQAGPPATVVSLIRSGVRRQPTILRLGFSSALDAASAQDTANYRLAVLTPGGHLRRSFAIRSAVYDPATFSVTLRPDSLLGLRFTYRLAVISGGVLDSQGHPIDGDGDGQPGGNYVRFFDRDVLVLPTEPTRPVVRLRPTHATLRVGASAFAAQRPNPFAAAARAR